MKSEFDNWEQPEVCYATLAIPARGEMAHVLGDCANFSTACAQVGLVLRLGGPAIKQAPQTLACVKPRALGAIGWIV